MPSTDTPVIVLSAPSAAGKTTAVARLTAAEPRLARCITATTRAPRPGERHGTDYLFLDEAAFAAEVAAGNFLEHALVYGRRYGSLMTEVEAVAARGRIPLLILDVQGHAAARTRLGARLRSVFLAPPSFAALEERLGARGDDPGAAAVRLAEARAEMARVDEFDAVVVNDDLDRCVAELAALIDGWCPKPSARAAA